jgi:hypothetical protein
MMNLTISLFMRQLLNESQQLRKKFAWNLQFSTSRYKMRKVFFNLKDIMNEAIMKTFAITTKAFKDDENIALMFITTWIRNIRVTWLLVNNESMIEIINKKLMNKMSIIKIKRDENLSITLFTNHRIILKEYVWITINCEDIEVYVKTYVCSMTVYDLLVYWSSQIRDDWKKNRAN